jgi:hypothetical protein
VKAYFEYVHPLYPFLDRQAFEAKASQSNLIHFLEGEPAFSALYHAVLALGCQHVGDGSFDPGKGRSWQIFQVSLAILPHILLPPDTEATLQVCPPVLKSYVLEISFWKNGLLTDRYTPGRYCYGQFIAFSPHVVY